MHDMGPQSARSTVVRPAKSVTRQDVMEMMGLSRCSNLAPSSSALKPHSVTTTVLALWEYADTRTFSNQRTGTGRQARQSRSQWTGALKQY